MAIRPFGFPVLIAILFGACTKQPQVPYVPLDAAAQYPYFPLEIGKYLEYTVDSVVYDFDLSGGTRIDSSRTWVRETVTDSLRDQQGQLVFSIERYERRSDTSAWQLRRVASAGRTATQAFRSDDNLRFLKLVFPFDRRSDWNGNLWIDPYREIQIAGERLQPFVNWHYEIDSLDVPGQIGAFAFDSLLVVTEVDETNAIERRLSRVKYAKHLGPVYQEQWILDSQYCNDNPVPSDCLSKPWVQKAEKGFILKQVLIRHN